MAVTAFRARKIITLDPACPEAEVVAVEEGRILHVGSESELRGALEGRDAVIDDRFADSVITPGFIEAHGHLLADGSLSRLVWLGVDDRPRPDGTLARGCRTIEELLDRLREALAHHEDPEQPLVGYGFDPVFHDLVPLGRQLLDRVSEDQAIVVLNASLHLAYANSAMLQRQGVGPEIDVAGLIKDARGEPTGELHEAALALVLDQASHFGPDLGAALGAGAALARRAGCTTASELALPLIAPLIELYGGIVEAPDFPLRVVYSPLLGGLAAERPAAEVLAELDALAASSTPRFGLGPLKWVADGSIQGFTASLGWPGYCGGHDHSTLLLDAEALVSQVAPFHEAGYQVAIHTNGDATTAMAVDALEQLLAAAPRGDHRHRLEHCQMASPAIGRRMAALGIGANLFVNHVYYWGDVHRRTTMGPDKARRLDAAATAREAGVAIALHSDHPVTPVAPLFTMWCAVNRLTRSGHLLGPHDRLSPLAALEAVTLGSAYLMRRDHELGSIEVGKWADLTVLGDDPLGVEPDALRELPVLATVLAGEPTEP